MPLEVTIDGLKEVLEAFAEYPEIAGPELKEASEAALLGLVDPISTYPEKEEDDSYRRTRLLGNNWTAAIPEFDAPIDGGDFEARLINPTEYGPRVQDAEFQAWMHQGVWQTTQDVLEAGREDIEGRYADALERIVSAIEAKASGGG